MLNVLLILPRLEHRIPSAPAVVLARGLRQRGCRVHLGTLTGDEAAVEELRRAGVAVERLACGPRFDPRALAGIWRTAFRLAPALVHLWQPLGTPLEFISAFPVLPAVLIASIASSTPLESSWRCRLHHCVARWLVPFPDMAERLTDRAVPPNQVAVVPPGVESGEDDAPDPQALRAAFGVPANARVIACAGPFVPEAGLKDAVWAADILNYLSGDVHLLLAGDGPERDRLRRFVRDIAADERVHFLGPRPDLHAVFRSADVVWLPEHQPGELDMVLAALAAGRPLVATRVAGRMQVLGGDAAGLLIAPGDKAALARATRQLFDDPALARRLAAAARDRARERFAPGAMVERHLAVYRETLARVRDPLAC